MQVLVTGVAGFIGAELALSLLDKGHQVVGLDNFNDYYDVKLKKDRVRRILDHKYSHKFELVELDISDRDSIKSIFNDNKFDRVVHLAAQAGVRYSIENPDSYIDSNLVGFGNILEGCRHQGVDHLVYASSSSVYGANKNFPFTEQDRVDNPVSLYAATKKANELMAHSYSHLYGFQCTGLRFFTVYGPWGRPDMAPFRFASRLLKGEALPIYNNGNMIRDFTYIDDIINGVVLVTEKKVETGKYRVLNIGRGEKVELMEFVTELAKNLGVEPILNMMPMQDGDVPRTMADTSRLIELYGYQPNVSIAEGVKKFSDWYKNHYQ